MTNENYIFEGVAISLNSPTYYYQCFSILQRELLVILTARERKGVITMRA